MTDKEILQQTLRDNIPKLDDENSNTYVHRAIGIICNLLGTGTGYQLLWKYHDGDHISKSRVKGFESLWMLAIARTLKNESISIRHGDD